jgi:hypothetical protein
MSRCLFRRPSRKTRRDLLWNSMLRRLADGQQKTSWHHIAPQWSQFNVIDTNHQIKDTGEPWSRHFHQRTISVAIERQFDNTTPNQASEATIRPIFPLPGSPPVSPRFLHDSARDPSRTRLLYVCTDYGVQYEATDPGPSVTPLPRSCKKTRVYLRRANSEPHSEIRTPS